MTFTKLFQNTSKIFSKFLQNYPPVSWSGTYKSLMLQSFSKTCFFFTFLNIFPKLFYNFPKFFQNFIIFLHIFSTVSLQVFQNFPKLTRCYLVISRKVRQKSPKSSWNFRKNFRYFYGIISKCNENFLQFLGKIPINAKFFRVFSKFVYCSNFWTLFRYFPKTVFRIFNNFIKFLRNFSTVRSFSKATFTYFHNFFQNFSLTTSYFLYSFSKIALKMLKFPLNIFKMRTKISKIFSIIFISSSFLNFPKILNTS